jgi:hypothetical protein
MSPRAPKTPKPKGLIRRKRAPTVTTPPTDPLPDAPKSSHRASSGFWTPAQGRHPTCRKHLT